MDYISTYSSNNGENLARLNDTKESSFKLIENVLSTHGLPSQLKYLAVIESGLNGNAVSPVGAVGYWQFMNGTARLMGLNVSSRRDDRRDLYKSTNAAAKSLKQLYGMFDDGLLVIAAYNSGPSPVLKAIKNTGSSSFWDIKKYLPRETQGHVMAFLATAAIMEKLGNFMGLSNMPMPANMLAPAAATDEYTPVLTRQELEGIAIVKVQGPYRLDVIARILEADVNLLKKWNPKFNEVMLGQPDFVYKLRIPKDKLEQFIDQRSQIYAESCTTYKKEGVSLQAKVTSASKHKVYTIQEGDNIDRIAMRFGKSVDELKVLNATRNLDAVPGAVIRIE
jgi:membrane-bound lytic murein transglycosylase D